MKFDLTRLPQPATYYATHFPSMYTKAEWSSVKCPFHSDRTPSLRLNLVHGHFRCHACGVRGGGILDFEMKLKEVGFKQAAMNLGAWSDDNGK